MGRCHFSQTAGVKADYVGMQAIARTCAKKCKAVQQFSSQEYKWYFKTNSGHINMQTLNINQEKSQFCDWDYKI